MLVSPFRGSRRQTTVYADRLPDEPQRVVRSVPAGGSSIAYPYHVLRCMLDGPADASICVSVSTSTRPRRTTKERIYPRHPASGEATRASTTLRSFLNTKTGSPTGQLRRLTSPETAGVLSSPLSGWLIARSTFSPGPSDYVGTRAIWVILYAC